VAGPRQSYVEFVSLTTMARSPGENQGDMIMLGNVSLELWAVHD
jgi:hypothetical protein